MTNAGWGGHSAEGRKKPVETSGSGYSKDHLDLSFI